MHKFLALFVFYRLEYGRASDHTQFRSVGEDTLSFLRHNKSTQFTFVNQ
jgi:hypothetical protein